MVQSIFYSFLPCPKGHAGVLVPGFSDDEEGPGVVEKDEKGTAYPALGFFSMFMWAWPIGSEILVQQLSFWLWHGKAAPFENVSRTTWTFKGRVVHLARWIFVA